MEHLSALANIAARGFDYADFWPQGPARTPKPRRASLAPAAKLRLRWGKANLVARSRTAEARS